MSSCEISASRRSRSVVDAPLIAARRNSPARRAARPRAAPRARVASSLAFVLERHPDLGAIALDLAVLQRHVELRDLGLAQIAQRRGRALDRRAPEFSCAASGTAASSAASASRQLTRLRT